jgi:hypothetical protein
MSTVPNTEPTVPPTTPPITPPAPTEIEKERDRVLAEANALRSRNKELETAAAATEKRLKDLERQGLKTSGDWQKLAEGHEADAKTWQEKFEKANGAFVETIRGGKVKEELFKLGLRSEASDDVDAMDLSGVPVDIVNGQMVVKGADLFAANLKKSKPYMFKDGTPPNVNPGNPGGLGTTQDLASLKKAYQDLYPQQRSKPTEFKAALVAYNNAVQESRKAKK